jgi:hypothetical protein
MPRQVRTNRVIKIAAHIYIIPPRNILDHLSSMLYIYNSNFIQNSVTIDKLSNPLCVSFFPIFIARYKKKLNQIKHHTSTCCTTFHWCLFHFLIFFLSLLHAKCALDFVDIFYIRSSHTFANKIPPIRNLFCMPPKTNRSLVGCIQNLGSANGQKWCQSKIPDGE